MKARVTPAVTADAPLSKDLTSAFISDLDSLLSEDGSVKARYLAASYKTKLVDADPAKAQDRATAAIEKWLLTEERNAATNRRISSLGNSDHICVLPGISARKFFLKVAQVIVEILGPAPKFDTALCGFSGGASTSKARHRSHPATKFLDQADITQPALTDFLWHARGSRWAAHIEDSGLDPRIVEGNVMFTVPKNSEIDRCACKEPDLNMFLQKGIGNQIRTQLRRVGVNLNDQSINGELARQASIDGTLMTVDLSSASDSVSCALVERVLPHHWFVKMNLYRSPKTEINGEWHVNEMFSSMGNGFTFELESLLFYSICRATAYFGGWKGRISVYGDDIIAPAGMFDDLNSALSFCGFSLNANKSFASGTFRESCGKHWDGGLDVSPFYLRRPFRSVSDLILTLNQLAEWASREISVLDPRYEDLFWKYAAYVPKSVWGGGDLTSRTSLVTGHAPRGELVYRLNTKDMNDLGGFLLWLFLACNRTSEGCLFVTNSTPTAFARVRQRSRVEWIRGEHDVPVFLRTWDNTVEANAG